MTASLHPKRAGTRSRQEPGYFSTRAFSLPVGRHVEAGHVRGYYIDLGVKAEAPGRPTRRRRTDRGLWVPTIQRALGCYERYLDGAGDRWLAAAHEIGSDLVAAQTRRGRRRGGWQHTSPIPHTYTLDPPWLSGMAQGQGASLLVRLHRETGHERFAEAALAALAPLSIPTAEGGVQATLDGRWTLPEEYPTSPPSFVLNGAIFAAWGLYDVAVGLEHVESARAFDATVAALAANLDRWDLGFWSRYDLFPHRPVNIASSAYHSLHIHQLTALNAIAPRTEFEAAAVRFAHYRRSEWNRARAFGRKSLFRLAHPRHRRVTAALLRRRR